MRPGIALGLHLGGLFGARHSLLLPNRQLAGVPGELRSNSRLPYMSWDSTSWRILNSKYQR